MRGFLSIVKRKEREPSKPDSRYILVRIYVPCYTRPMTPRRDPPEESRSLPQHWFQVLLALADRSRHGLGIIEEVGRQTDGEVRLWPGMLYVALKRMSAEGLVTDAEPPAGFASGGGRPRFYRITPAGRQLCAAEAERLSRLVHAARAKRVLKEPA